MCTENDCINVIKINWLPLEMGNGEMLKVFYSLYSMLGLSDKMEHSSSGPTSQANP